MEDTYRITVNFKVIEVERDGMIVTFSREDYGDYSVDELLEEFEETVLYGEF